MKPGCQTYELSADVRDSEIRRLLGYGDHPVPPRVALMIEEARAEATPLLAPRCTVLRVGSRELRGSDYLGHLDDVVLGLVTIGTEVEGLAEALDRKREVVRALVVNTFGSAAAEAATDAANALVRERVAAGGLRCSRRFSPGYGGWDVAEQRWIVPLLKGDALGVTLTEGCMMVPRKSTTFAVTVGDPPVEMRGDNACDACDLTECTYRRESAVIYVKGKPCTTFTARHSDFCPRDRWS